MKSQPLERKFIRPSTISEYLKCPICLDVLHNAMRLYCGHTLCDACLNDYMKTGTTCPQCRTKIDVKNIGVDLLARQIINEFQVFCIAQDCPWKGVLQQLQKHVNIQCIFAKGSGHAKVKKNEKVIWHETVDDDVLDKINEHTAKGSLEARILIKTDSIMKESAPTKFNIAASIHNTEAKSKNKSKRGKGANNKIPPAKQARTSSFDFLSSLFE